MIWNSTLGLSFIFFFHLSSVFSLQSIKIAPSSMGSPSSRRSPTQTRQMTLEITHLYVSLLSEFFTLSDSRISQLHAASASQNQSQNAATLSPTMPPWVPRGTNSLTTGVWVGRMLSEIAECVGEVNALDIGDGDGSRGSSSGSMSGDQQGLTGLKNLMESARWRFEEAVCETWAAGQTNLSSVLVDSPLIED